MKKIRIAAWLLIIVMALSSVACSKRNASTEIQAQMHSVFLTETV